MAETGKDLVANRTLWTLVNSAFTDEDAFRAWAASEVTWGLFHVPEREVRVLGDVRGLDVIELGCGTAYLSAWLARRGAPPVSVDLTRAQLRTAVRCQQRWGPVFPLIEADAENVPMRSRSFDLVVSEYGASVWCDPERWLRRRHGCCGPVGGWCSSPTASWSHCVYRRSAGSPANASCGRNERSVVCGGPVGEPSS